MNEHKNLPTQSQPENNHHDRKRYQHQKETNNRSVKSAQGHGDGWNTDAFDDSCAFSDRLDDLNAGGGEKRPKQ